LKEKKDLTSDINKSKVKFTSTVIIVTICILLSKITGLLREQMFAYFFGANWETDAFRISFLIPNQFRQLLADAILSAAFIPVFSSYLALGKKRDAKKLANTLINLLIIIFILIIIIVFITIPSIYRILPGLKDDLSQRSLAILLTRIMFLSLLFMGLTAIVSALLNSYESFVPPAFSTVIWNILIILVVLLLYRKYGILSFAIGIVIGTIGQFLFLLPFLRNKDFNYELDIDLNHTGVKEVMLLSFPIILSLGSAQLNNVINKVFALSIGSGETTILEYASYLWFFPVGIFAVAVSTIIFPLISKQAAKNQIEDLKDSFLSGTKLTNFLLTPSFMGIISLAHPIIKLIFERGKFTSNNTISTAVVLSYLALSLVPYGMVLILNRTFFALKDSKTPLKVAIFSICCTLFFNMILVRFLKTAGLALSTSLVISINFLLLFLLLRKKIGRLGGTKILYSTLKIFFASCIMAVFTHFAHNYIYNLLSPYKLGLLFSILISITLAIMVYIALCFILKIEELNSFLQVIKERFKTP